ncbi:AroA 5-enolpyruvylshikimate-3-phosphate synthase [Rhabdaerophilaceae bacterium]
MRPASTASAWLPCRLKVDVMSHSSLPKPMRAEHSGALRGIADVPGDKSISHRALLFGLLSVGETRVSGLLEGEDVLRTADAARALGANVEHLAPGEWRVRGMGVGTLLAPRATLDFGNAGTGSRLMIGVIGGHSITARIDGDASLRKRPMGRIIDPLKLMGARVLDVADGNRLPLTLQGARDAIPITYETPVASAQIKSAVLFAGLNAPGETTVIEAEASRDHTEKLLTYFGADVTVAPHGVHGRRVTLKGQPTLVPRSIIVPADPSSAAFPIVAALITPDSDIVVKAVMMNPLRTGLLITLREMGADITELERREEGGETVADLRVRHSALKGVTVPAERAPSMIDEYPVLAVAAAFATGETRMNGLQELRVKESDRLAAVSEGLRVNGVDHEIAGDDLIVSGTGRAAAGGGMVETQMDHRIAMSFLVMGLASVKPVGVDDVTFIATSFPDFLPLMTRLGGRIV